MNVVIKKIDVLKATKLALKHRLFVSGWDLGKELSEINSLNTKKYEICLAFDQDIPIGICLKKFHKKNNHLMVFVRKSYRKNGIGRKLVCLLKDDKSYGTIGIEKSNGKIWKSNGITYN